MTKIIKKMSILFFIIILNLLISQTVLADDAVIPDTSEDTQNTFAIVLDQATLAEGYTASFDLFKLGIGAGALKSDSVLEVIKMDGEEMPLPENKRLISEIYQFDIKNKALFNNKKPLNLEIGYNDYSDDLKQIYFWNKTKGVWQRLPSSSDVKSKMVKSIIHLPYARVAVLGDIIVKESGYASWYKYKDCDCAASPDYPKKTKIKVTNMVNGKSVIVRINDWGPERNIFPDRVIDLDVTAFKKIADKRLGIVKVKIEPVENY
jgi:rare lipoprotein A